MNREPAAIIGAVSTAVASILALVVAFGVDLSQEQQTAILAVVAGVGPIVVALLIRPRVASPATVEKIAADAHKDGREEATTVEVFRADVGALRRDVDYVGDRVTQAMKAQPTYPTRREYHAD